MLPDVLPVARTFLRNHATMQALVSTRVHAVRTPANYPLVSGDTKLPWLLLTPFAENSVTNTAADRTVDVSIQLEAWGRYLEDHAYVRSVVATAHDLLRSQFPAYVDATVKISSVLPDSGLQPLPDDEFALARCMASVRVIAYPK